MPHQIQDGVRYLATQGLKNNIFAGIGKRAAAKENKDGVKPATKRQKTRYIVDAYKFASTATEEQLAMDLTEADFGTEETHKIIQCKIR